MSLTAPLINLNGNSKDVLIKDVSEIYKSLQKSIEYIALADYDHGRNSIDFHHAKKMQSEKSERIKILRDTQDEFVELHKTIVNS